MSEKQYVQLSGELKGRRKIYTDASEITEDNVISVLTNALHFHEANRNEMKFLLDFEKGNQPLQRDKTVRTEIDIKSISNLASEITEFWLGYFWGNPIALFQKSAKNPRGSNPEVDDNAITLLNEMLECEDKDSKDQQLARYIEICGVGLQMIDIKRDYIDGESVFDLITLNPMYAFVVYSSDAYERKLLGVSYSERANGDCVYTCISKDTVYIVENLRSLSKTNNKKDNYTFGKRNGELNPLGMVPIIEFERSFDRTGRFERQVDELNALNILESDFVNDVAQNTQAIWHCNDAEFGDGDEGKVQGGQWIFTKTTGNGQKPFINPLTLNYDYAGVLENIRTKHDYILERTFVPKQSDPGGGSTTGAMSLSSGWSATEAVASKQALVLKQAVAERNRLILAAIKKSVDIEPDSPLLKLKASDIEIRFIRRKTFDMATKINTFATGIKNGVSGRVMMETIDLFPNLAEAWEDSKNTIEKYQKQLFEKQTIPSSTLENNSIEGSTPNDPDRMMSDDTDQINNSPLIGN